MGQAISMNKGIVAKFMTAQQRRNSYSPYWSGQSGILVSMLPKMETANDYSVFEVRPATSVAAPSQLHTMVQRCDGANARKQAT